MKKYRSIGSIAFDAFNYLFLTVYALIAVIPLVYVFTASFSSAAEIAKKGFVIIPSEPTLSAYRYIFSTSMISNSIMVSVYITVVGTVINMLMTTLTAYPLAEKDLTGRHFLLAAVTFTMVFNAGMVPSYILVRSMGLIDSLWSLMIPGAISAWNLIVLKNFFQNIPVELKESARIDGCNDFRIFVKIVLPLSTPALATFTIFYAVGNWNAFTSAIMYINDIKKWPIQVMLRQVVMMAQGMPTDEDSVTLKPPVESVKMAIIVVATLPILVVYPFFQKHFAKGVMVGAIKG